MEQVTEYDAAAPRRRGARPGDPGDGAAAAVPLDVLVIGGQDGLQLRLEGVRRHLGIYIQHHALKLSCIDAVLERN